MDEQNDKQVAEPERQLTDEEILRAIKARYNRMIQKLNAIQVTLIWRVIFTPLAVVNILLIFLYLNILKLFVFPQQLATGSEFLIPALILFGVPYFVVAGFLTLLAFGLFLRIQKPSKGVSKIISVLIYITIALYILPTWIFILNYIIPRN